jgi:predicted amidophosphoribosyltransferase
MTRSCPSCGATLDALAVRCGCGNVLPEGRDLLSDPEHPACGVCHQTMPLMQERCSACGADGYPAMRARRGKRTQGPPP